jgi:hypothetical protein
MRYNKEGYIFVFLLKRWKIYAGAFRACVENFVQRCVSKGVTHEDVRSALDGDGIVGANAV